MRVVQLHLVHPDGPSDPVALRGARPTVHAVASAAHRAGAEVIVVQAGDADADGEWEGVRYRFVAEPRLPGRATGIAPWRIARAVADLAPRIVHLNGLDFPWHTRAVCTGAAPVLAQDHASGAQARRLRRRWGLGRIAGAMFTAEAQAAPFFAHGLFRPRLPIFAVPESSTHFTAGSQEEARARTGIHGDPAVLWVGRLDANKDPLTILAAIEQAAPQRPGLQLWCCFHEAALLDRLSARIASSPMLRERVHLLGRVPHDRIEPLCRAADFFMLGSHREGSGYALIEAMACGATPIVSDIPSFRALTGEGRIGALAPVGDAAAFAAALIRLAARPRPLLREQARAHFDRALSFDAIGRQLCAAYATVIGGRA